MSHGKPHYPDEMEAEVKEAMQAISKTCDVLANSGMNNNVLGSALLNLLFVRGSSGLPGHYDPCSDHEIVQAALAFSHARLHKHLGTGE